MATRKWVVWSTLAHAAVLDSLRRKDLAVAGILSVLLVAGASALGRFGVRGLELFLKDAALTVIDLLGSVMTVLFATRQIPEELARRTVLPLLARPIGRGDFLIGKFLGAWTLSIAALGIFGAIVAGMAACLGVSLGLVYVQYLLLKALALGVLCAVSLSLSCWLTAPAATTMALVLAIGTGTFGRALMQLEGSTHGFVRLTFRAAWLLLPQFNLFDLKEKVSYGWPPVAGWVVWALAGYGLVHATLWLWIAHARFRRQAL
ncbi:MAG: ABC transporter permease [Armatimonadota bacterium]